MRQIWGIAKADFLERSRRFSFIAMLALALFGAFCFVPDNSSLNIIQVDPERFVQGGNPTWMTIASAWGLVFFLPLVGFFYVSGSQSFDEKKGLSQIVFSSPSGGIHYMFGKFLASVMLLYCTILTTFLGSVVMMLIQFPGQFPSIYSMLSPYFVFLPTALIISALSLLFDSTRFLRKSIGGIAYVFTFFFILYRAVSESMPVFTKAIDITGYKIISDYISREVFAQSGVPMKSLKMLAGSGAEEQMGTNTLIFHGVDWQASDVWGMLIMTVLSLVLVVISSSIYGVSRNVKLNRTMRKSPGVSNDMEQLPTRLADYVPGRIPVTNKRSRKLAAECRLMLAGLPLIWYLIAFGGWLAAALMPLKTVQAILPLILLWPLSVYSSMGCREHLHGTLKYIAILPKGLSRQMILTWVSGILISIFLLLPVLLRMLIAGEYSGAFVCICGMIFIASLALFLGEWTHTRRAFEVVYISLAYLVMNGLTEISYLEVRVEYLSIGRAVFYLVIGIAFLELAVMKRVGRIIKN